MVRVYRLWFGLLLLLGLSGCQLTEQLLQMQQDYQQESQKTAHMQQQFMELRAQW